MTAIQERPATDARNLIGAKMRATLVSNMQAKFPNGVRAGSRRPLVSITTACQQARAGLLVRRSMV